MRLSGASSDVDWDWDWGLISSLALAVEAAEEELRAVRGAVEAAAPLRACSRAMESARQERIP